ncbi:MAG: type II CAAX endopeptidase family protein [Parachlamydiaceae bacterium]|nr:type II CAAX endopeptidase family protein [Parachlamydiaceae bacterium]
MELTNIQEQMDEKWMIIQWALGLGMIALFIGWKQGLLKSFKWMTPPVIRGYEVLLAFFVFLFFEIILIPMIALVFLKLFGSHQVQIHHLSNLTKFWINLFVVLGGFIGIVLMIFRLDPTRRKLLFQQTSDPWFKNFAFGILLWCVTYPFLIAFSESVGLFVLYFFQYTAIDQIAVANMKQLMAHPLLFKLTALEIVTIVPFTEEVLFRGFLQNWLKSKWKHPVLSIMVSAAVFSLFHFSFQYGLTNIELLSSLFLMGCVLGWVYERQHSLWASIGLHSFFNMMSIIFLME